MFGSDDLFCMYSLKSSTSLVDEVRLFPKLKKVDRDKVVIDLLNICKMELSNVAINIENRSYSYSPLFITKDFLVEYFEKKLIDSIYEYQEKQKGSVTSSAFEIFSETVNFIDQLPFENLLMDTLAQKLELISRIEITQKMTQLE